MGSRAVVTVDTVKSNQSDDTKKYTGTRLWKPGQSGNPSGRPLGARSKFSQAFHEDLLKVWLEEGERAMRKVAKHDPATFVRVAASLMPKQVKAEINNLRTLVVELVGADQALTKSIEYDDDDDDIIEGELEDDD